MGTEFLDPDVLVDSLVVDVIDGLREELHPLFGVRAYKVFTEARTWSGNIIGEGSLSKVEVELRPQPRVRAWDQGGRGFELDLAKCGIDELGEIKLTEISLTNTFKELAGRDPNTSLPKNQEFLLRLEDAHGQANPVRYFTHTRPPFVDREKDMGWVMWLRRTQVRAGT